jgi:hypothetical protein
MADFLRAGFPSDLPGTVWNNPTLVSMAKDMETAMTALIPPAKDDKPDQRRLFFMAIAAGVINHLQKNQNAFAVTVPDGSGGTLTVNPVITIQTS